MTNILTAAVQIAGEEIKSKASAFDEIIANLGSLPKGQMTETEEDLLRLATIAHKHRGTMISIKTVVKIGGADARGLPHLAIATYEMCFERQRTYVTVEKDGAVIFGDYSRRVGFEMFLPEGTLPPATGLKSFVYPKSGFTMTPLIPILYRQDVDKDDLFVLFEANGWVSEPKQALSYLLHKVTNDIYYIVGSWNATEKESKMYQIARDLDI